MQNPNRHRCRIDCRNNSQVMDHLMNKSEHLYRFWLNYNELYNKCTSMSTQLQQLRMGSNKPPPTPVHSGELDSYRQRVAELQAANAKLRDQIARLKDDKRGAALTQNQINELTADYEREINRLKEVKAQQEGIIRTKDDEIRRQIGEYDGLRRTLSDEKNKWANERDELTQQIYELKRQLNRPKTPTTVVIPQTPTHELDRLKNEIAQRDELLRRKDEQLRRKDDQIRKKDDEIKRLLLLIRTNEERYKENLRQQLDLARRDLKAEFQNLLGRLRDGCMSMTTVVETYETRVE